MKIALTGHRPEFFGDKDIGIWCENYQKALEIINPQLVISGLCRGWDNLGAQWAIDNEIKVSGYCPFPEFGNNWNKEAQNELQEIRANLHEENMISKHYHKGCFHDRDRAMVDDCDVVFALLNPKAKKGGTKYTVDYAKKMNKPVFNFWNEPDWLALENL